jgi:hypothetical protein
VILVEKSGVVNTAISLLPRPVRHVVLIGDVVTNSQLLVAVSRTVVTREVYDFLTTLDAAYPGPAVD